MKAYIKAPEFGEAQKIQEHHLQDVISDNLSPQLVGVVWEVSGGCVCGVGCLWGYLEGIRGVSVGVYPEQSVGVSTSVPFQKILQQQKLPQILESPEIAGDSH